MRHAFLRHWAVGVLRFLKQVKSTMLELAHHGNKLRNGEGATAKQHGACLKFQYFRDGGRRIRNSRSFFRTPESEAALAPSDPALKKQSEETKANKPSPSKQGPPQKMSTLNSGSRTDLCSCHPVQLFSYPLNVFPGFALVFLLFKIPRTSTNLLCRTQALRFLNDTH